ncbi:hypothetical protein J6590_103900 [Homalodisca vitripennis]|nr:hypothetical protein J6590_103900 [Homalodisca vitripennis]
MGIEKRCDQNIDECASEPCLHGGTCVDGLASYTCVCSDEYVGERCEQVRLITCDSQPCSNGASCLDVRNDKTNDNFTCTCAPYYAGNYCEMAYCEVESCQKGFCKKDAKPPFCQCDNGFEGRYCEIDIDECKSNPCLNNGSCIDGIATFSCNCTGTGFQGGLCEVDIDECSYSPFGDGTWFQGRLCEVDIDECSYSPCGDGTCENTLGSFLCLCSDTTCDRLTTRQATSVDKQKPQAADGTRISLEQLRISIGKAVLESRSSTGRGFKQWRSRLARANATLLKTNNSIARINNSQGWLWGEAPEITARQHTSTQLCAGTGQISNPCQNEGTCEPTCTLSASYKCVCPPGYQGINCTEQSHFGASNVADIALIVVPIVAILLIAASISLSVFLMMARKKRATRGTYSPSSQEYCNPRVELDNVMKPPPEERLI